MTEVAYVLAFAAPAIRHQGGDPGVLGGRLDRDRARSLLATLFGMKNGDDVTTSLAMLERVGQRAEWESYRVHAGTAWSPDPHDLSMVRKVDFALRRRDELGTRALVAWDAMRACVIAGWAVRAGFLAERQVWRSVGGIVVRALAEHTGWDDVAAHLRAAQEFVRGEVDADFAASLEWTWPWPTADERPAPPEEDDESDDDDDESDDDDDDETPIAADAPLTVLSLALSIDCHGCGGPASWSAITERNACARCGTERVLSAADWRYLFASDAKKFRTAADNNDDITNDFGEHFFSRRETRRCEAARCPCGEALSTEALRVARETITCPACATRLSVRPADALVRAIDRRACLVIGERVEPASAPDFACLGCERPITPDARIVTCTCGARNFVDNAAWSRVTGRRGRPTMHVLFAW